jgi:putative hydrolase of the HAD superfamily
MSETQNLDRARAVLVVVSGRVASGKSTISRALAARLGAVRLEADRVRGTLLAAVGDDASGSEARWRRDLSPAFEDEVYVDLLSRADARLAEGAVLVLDACFPRRAQRAAVLELARKHGVPFLGVECHASEETLRARLEARDRIAGHAGWAAIYQRLADHCEAIDASSEPDWLRVHADGATEPAIQAILARLGGLIELPELATPEITPLPRVVSFDCWSTLLAEHDWPWAHALRVAALADAAQEAGSQVDRAACARAFDAAWGHQQQLWEGGRATGAHEVASWALAELGLAHSHPAQDHLVRRFEEASHTSRVVEVDGALALLRALERAGVGRVLVCDTGLTPGRVVRRLLDRVGLLDLLEVLAFSDEVGAPKPDPRAFLAALEPLGVDPKEALHVGDLRRTDVAGARALGMRSVRIHAYHDDASALPDADFVVGSHAELAGLLGLHLPVDGSAE